MHELSLDKIVIHGWDNMTASIAEGIRYKFPKCKILCCDISNEEFIQANREGYLDPLPESTALIYEDADFILINQDSKNSLLTLEKINTFLDPQTCIMDFQHIKQNHYEETSHLLSKGNPYVSVFIFFDEYPQGIRKNIFKDKIIALICDNSTEILMKMKLFWNLLDAKIIPTSAEFFDEIYATTMQMPNLVATVYSHILQNDSWADTLFFGFYNKQLRSFVSPVSSDPKEIACNLVDNRENILRTISFIKREMEELENLIDNENKDALIQYISVAKQFKNRI